MSEAWATAELGDLFELRNEKSKQIKATEYRETGDLPVVDQSERFLAGYIDDHSRAFSGKLPVIVFGDHTRITKFIDFPFGAGADGTQILDPKPQVDARFLYHVVSQASELIGNFGYDRHLKHLRRYKASYPISKPAQRRIAEILSTLDETIEQTEELIAKMQQVKAGLMHDLFTRGVTPDGRLRPTREQAPELYKESPFGWIPREWDYGTLQDVVSPNRPIVYGILMPGAGFPGGIPVIKVKDIVEGEILTENLLLTSPQIDAEYQRSKLKSGDILLTIRGSVGRLAQVAEDLDGANITQDTARIGIVRGVPLFYRYFLETDISRGHFDINTLGQAVQGINLRDVRTTPVTIPPDIEQQLIAERVESFSISLKENTARALKLRQEKIGLMRDLLTGCAPVK